MADHPTSESSTQLDDLIAEFVVAEEAGQLVSRDELVAQHPQWANQLRQYFADRDRIQGVARQLRMEPPRRPFVPPTVRYFGDYELLEKIAHGGMGVVYKARQTSLKRTVAVKLILSGHLASEEDVKRFQSEAEAAANLNHPAIVAIYEVGMHEGQHYFSMEYVAGRSLAQLVAEKPLPARQAARYVEAIAEAVHFAHQEGTLHRDLKPSNILVDEQDRVHITDFGLAMRVESDSDLTRTGQILGTAAYMAPEQAQAKRALIGPASDVYSMGVILYELVTGRPPFKAESSLETLQQVIETEPVSPRLLNPRVPRDLETICLKCLAKEPHRRYATAGEFAQDLGWFLGGETIRARPVGRIERTWRRCKRQPALAGLSAALVLTAIGGFVSVTWQWRRAEINAEIAVAEASRAHNEAIQAKLAQGRTEKALADLKQEQEQRTKLETSIRSLEARRTELSKTLKEGKRQLYETYIQIADSKWRAGDLNGAKQYLDSCPPDYRTWIWHFYNKQCFPLVATEKLGPGTGAPPTVDELNDFSLRDGKIRFDSFRVQADSQLPTIHVADGDVDIDYENRKLKMNIDGDQHTGSIQSRAISPDGEQLAFGMSFGWRGRPPDSPQRIYRVYRLVVIDVQSGRLEYAIPFHDRSVIQIAFSSDGRKIAVVTTSDISPRKPTAKADYVISIWAAKNGTAIRHLPPQVQPIAAMSFSEEAHLLAVANDDGIVNVWDATPFWESTRLRVENGPVCAIAFSPDGRLLASGVGRSFPKRTHSIVISSAKSGEEVMRLNEDANDYWRFEFSPDGRLLASAGSTAVSVWDLESGEQVFRQPGNFYGIAFSADGRRLATSTNLSEGQTKVFECEDWHEFLDLNEGGYAVQFSPDSKNLALSRGKGLAVWKLDEKPQMLFEISLRNNVIDIDYDRQGGKIAATMFNVIYIFDAATGSKMVTIPADLPLDVEFLDDRRLLAATERDAIHFWDAESGTEVLSLKNPSISDRAVANLGPFSIAFSPDSLRLAAGWCLPPRSEPGSNRGSVEVWDLGVGEQSIIFPWLLRDKAQPDGNESL